MPSLTLRSLGMSYALEAGPETNLNLEALHQVLSTTYGPAIASLSSKTGSLEAILIDRKAASWKELLGRILGYCEERGMGPSAWLEVPHSAGVSASLDLSD